MFVQHILPSSQRKRSQFVRQTRKNSWFFIRKSPQLAHKYVEIYTHTATQPASDVVLLFAPERFSTPRRISIRLAVVAEFRVFAEYVCSPHSSHCGVCGWWSLWAKLSELSECDGLLGFRAINHTHRTDQRQDPSHCATQATKPSSSTKPASRKTQLRIQRATDITSRKY